MRHITCRACGKGYNYEVDGCCPHCGAYNRPPRRVTIESDGSIHAAGGDKVCYEQKVCYEGQTRHRGKVSFSSLRRAEEKHPLDFTAVQNAGKSAYAKGKAVYKKGKQSAILAVVVAVLAALLPGWISSCSDSDTVDPPSDYEWSEEVDSVTYQYVSAGSKFYWYGEQTLASGNLYFPGEPDRAVYVRVQTDVEPETAMPTLRANDAETQWTVEASEAKPVTGGYEYVYEFPSEAMPDFKNDRKLSVDLDFQEGACVTRVTIK
jgi:hypothetical protein